MTITPIDLQVSISQQIEVGKLQQASQDLPAQQQAHQAAQIVQQTLKNENTVQRTMESENREIDDREGKGNAHSRERRERREMKKNEGPVPAKDPVKGRFIDIIK